MNNLYGQWLYPSNVSKELIPSECMPGVIEQIVDFTTITATAPIPGTDETTTVTEPGIVLSSGVSIPVSIILDSTNVDNDTHKHKVFAILSSTHNKWEFVTDVETIPARYTSPHESSTGESYMIEGEKYKPIIRTIKPSMKHSDLTTAIITNSVKNNISFKSFLSTLEQDVIDTHIPEVVTPPTPSTTNDLPQSVDNQATALSHSNDPVSESLKMLYNNSSKREADVDITIANIKFPSQDFINFVSKNFDDKYVDVLFDIIIDSIDQNALRETLKQNLIKAFVAPVDPDLSDLN